MFRYFFVFFNDTATTEIYTLSLHDALPICRRTGASCVMRSPRSSLRRANRSSTASATDRKSTRLNSCHDQISYAVFCLKKKKITIDCILAIFNNYVSNRNVYDEK